MKQHLKTSTIIKVILYLIISFVTWDLTFIFKFFYEIPNYGNGERFSILFTFVFIELLAFIANDFINNNLKNKTNGGK